MLVLFETSVGFCLFKLVDSGKLESEDLWKEFETSERASNLLKLKAIHRFTSTAEAVEDATAIAEGKLSKGLKKFLLDEISGQDGKKGKGKNETLAVVDPKLGGAIAKKLSIKVVSDSTVQDLYRGIRQQLSVLLDGLDPKDLSTMNLGLSHSLSRYKLKFSTEKIDTMIVQAIGLLDDLDKEGNIYAMRVKEWYGWHFPEMSKIITDNLAYAKVVKAMGFRTNTSTTDFSAILPEELEESLRAAAEISMGTEISDTDIVHIQHLADQVISITGYRAQLYDYLQNRMRAIAPNLTAIVGELVGARLIAHAGSLMNLAKFPASTIQILGAEKALFRALKTKHDTPKYGIIFHASLVGQASQKLKGKMARMTATKTALSIRVDALADDDSKASPDAPIMGIENRARLEQRLAQLEGRTAALPSRGSGANKQGKFEMQGSGATYNDAADATAFVPTQPPTTPGKREKEEEESEEEEEEEEAGGSAKKEKKSKEERKAEKAARKAEKAAKKEEKKRRKSEGQQVNGDAVALATPAASSAAPTEATPKSEKKEKKEKKKRRASEMDGVSVAAAVETPDGGEKKKKKHKSKE